MIANKKMFLSSHFITFYIGSIFVTIWTLLRFFTQQSVFDLVSQQIIVHQWLHGSLSVAHVGQTAYIPKMLLIYIPLDVLPVSPRLKLIICTIVINITTFVLIAVLLKKILQAFKVKVTNSLDIGLIWISMIAGSVFWIGIINSRNIEVAGGLLLIYLTLRFLESPSRTKGIILGLTSGFIFFSDPLQFYMVALSLVFYSITLYLRHQAEWFKPFFLATIFMAGFVLSKTIFSITQHFLQLSFNETNGMALHTFSAQWLLESLKGLARSTAILFLGANDAGKIREAANLGLLFCSIMVFMFGIWKKRLSQNLKWFCISFIIIDELIYVFSGQAAEPGTSRYLIMLAPILVLALSSVKLPERSSDHFVVLFICGLLINAGFLMNALIRNWDTSFPKDDHVESAYRYEMLHSADTQQLYTSIDTGLPLLYYHDISAQNVLPLGCSQGSLVRTYYSMDKEFKFASQHPIKNAAIVMDGNSITNTPSICNEDTIAQSFGQPTSKDMTDDGSMVLIYKQSALHIR